MFNGPNEPQHPLGDHAVWTREEMALLAGLAFGSLDETDYGEYLDDEPGTFVTATC